MRVVPTAAAAPGERHRSEESERVRRLAGMTLTKRRARKASSSIAMS